MPGMRTDLLRSLQARAFRQSGYFTAAQAREIGYSYQAQKYHVDAGNWVRVDRGLFRLPAWPSAPEDEFVRWTLWSGGRGVLSHESALRIHDLSDVDPAKIHMSVPAGFRATDPMVTVHRADVPAEDREEHMGWSVTTVLRTLADVAGSAMSQEFVDAAVNDALEREGVTRRRLLHRSAELPDRAALRLERAIAAVDDHG